MLIAETISKLINLELSTEKACEYVRQLNSMEVNADVLKQAIDTLSTFADAEAVEAVRGGGADLLDCCGTGGSRLPHFNTSTMVAFILAAAEVRVAKFGNRASTSLSGSFDLLETLGIVCCLPPAHCREILDETNLVFLFAQQFYPPLKKLAPIRQAVGIRTVFNLVGPLLNPVLPQFRLLGVPSLFEQKAIAEYLAKQKTCQRAFVVSSKAGLDELDPEQVNTIFEVEDGALTETVFNYQQRFLQKREVSLNIETNGRIFRAIMENELDEFPYYRALVCLNAAAGLCVARKVNSIEEGIYKSAELLLSGAVLKKFEQCRRVYARYSS